jgi:hypothetical protein
VLERTKGGTVCVYDMKTGEKGLDFPRVVEIATSVFNRYGVVPAIIVTEVRPRLALPQR